MTYPARLVCVASVLFLLTTDGVSADDSRPTTPGIATNSPPQFGPQQARPEPVVVQLVQSGPTGLTCRTVVSEFEVPALADGARVQAEGWFNAARPGEPDLPSRVLLVGLPQQGGVRLAVSVAGTETRTGVVVRSAPGFSEDGSERHPDPADGAGLYPAQPAELASIETIRGIRVASIRVSPAQYDRSTRTLRLHREVRLDVQFERPAREVARHDPLDDILAEMLVNGADAVRWSMPARVPDTINFFSRSPVWCKVVTETTGIYRVTPAELKAAGFDPDNILPSTMKLYSIGSYPVNGPYPDTMVELPVYLQEDGDGKFNGSDFLAFYAEAQSRYTPGDTSWRFNPFTQYSCYWLTWGGATGRRMVAVSAAGAANPRRTAPRRLRLEPDSLCPARSGLLWLWRRFYKPADVESGGGPVVLALPQRDTIYALSGRMLGVAPTSSLVYRPVVLSLNGLTLDTIQVGAKASTPPWTDFSFRNFPAGVAARGSASDTLMVRLISTQEADVYLDYLELRYAQQLKLSSSDPYLEFSYDSAGLVEFSIDGAANDGLVLDVTDPLEPRELANASSSGSRLDYRLTLSGPARFCCALKSRLRAPVRVERRTPGNLRRPSEQADYYIVCPDEFVAVAQLYARYRQGNVAGLPGATVRAARLSEIYDDYAFGQAEPGAIKRFLQAKLPAYVLLAGDGTYDYKNVLGQAAGPMVPAYEVGYDVDPEVYGQTAKALDAWYADLDGTGTSPDLVLGRVTVRNAVEFRAFLDKVRRYESQPLGSWAKRLILLADDEYLGDPSKPDGIGFAHINGCEQIANIGYSLLDPAKVYLTEYPVGQRGSGSETALRAELNRGALLWFFFGHGAGFQLNHEMTLHITNSVPNISNGSRTPLALFGSCGVGRFDDTRYSSIAEELVRKKDGCIVTSGATKATSPGGNEMLAQIWLRSLLNYPGCTAGMAFFQAWRTNTLYHLFGDPATVLRIPLPGPSPQTRPDTFYPGGRVNLRGNTPLPRGSYYVTAHESDWLRTYQSDRGTIGYVLPGYLIHSGAGTFDSGVVHTSFVVPRIPYPETTVVPNGSYVREPGSGRVSLLTTTDAGAYSSLRNSIPLGTAAAVADTQPPRVTLYAGDILLRPGDTTLVPKTFNLTGLVSDSSGIMLLPIPELSLSLSIGTSQRISLAEFFAYDQNSTTTGRFSYPVQLSETITVFTVRAADNLADPARPGSNRTTVTVLLRTSPTDALRLTDCLVYPNPAAGRAAFTFRLTLPALVSVRIFTISGRLVRTIQPQLCDYGYNQIHWDGLDKDGHPLANGIYLYRLDARPLSGGNATGSASFRDKFIVYR